MKNEAIAQEMMFLAFKASKPVGMGYVQYNPDGDEEKKQRIYDLLHKHVDNDWSISGDYIEGRMVKLHIKSYYFDQDKWLDQVQRPDYQSWAKEYPTNRALYEAAMKNLEVQDERGN